MKRHSKSVSKWELEKNRLKTCMKNKNDKEGKYKNKVKNLKD